MGGVRAFLSRLFGAGKAADPPFPSLDRHLTERFRLDDQPADAYLRAFEAAPLDIANDGSRESEIILGIHEICIFLPPRPKGSDDPFVEVARQVLGRIVAFDAIATRDVDGQREDGELVAIHVISTDAFDLEYSAVNWNSPWNEMFVFERGGDWTHRGVRKSYPRS